MFPVVADAISVGGPAAAGARDRLGVAWRDKAYSSEPIAACCGWREIGGAILEPWIRSRIASAKALAAAGPLASTPKPTRTGTSWNSH
jgi:hypothetical protein